MDQFFPKPARFPHGLLTVALAPSLLPGCAWLKDQAASKPAADPERKQMADSKAGEKITAPVGLDGSASGNGAPATPNARGVTGRQNLATGRAAGAVTGPAADDPTAGLPSLSGRPRTSPKPQWPSPRTVRREMVQSATVQSSQPVPPREQNAL